MEHHFRQAKATELDEIWGILQQAIERRKKDGSDQWQDGYPNPDVVKRDFERDAAYVLVNNQDEIMGYAAILFNDEPAYDDLVGNWLTNEDFVVLHRLAISENHLGKGLAQEMLVCTEDLARKNNIFSIKIDTNFDNAPMLKIVEKLGYVYCGEVTFRGGVRKAFEKVLNQ